MEVVSEVDKFLDRVAAVIGRDSSIIGFMTVVKDALLETIENPNEPIKIYVRGISFTGEFIDFSVSTKMLVLDTKEFQERFLTRITNE